mmetsp:Transcript_7726/g.17893  ORF Transcript_7726/g.17893 Transcript_7726/m.17893 type:complete len:303 (-) Transcript_7726:532-1440(-)
MPADHDHACGLPQFVAPPDVLKVADFVSEERDISGYPVLKAVGQLQHLLDNLSGLRGALALPARDNNPKAKQERAARAHSLRNGLHKPIPVEALAQAVQGPTQGVSSVSQIQEFFVKLQHDLRARRNGNKHKVNCLHLSVELLLHLIFGRSSLGHGGLEPLLLAHDPLQRPVPLLSRSDGSQLQHALHVVRVRLQASEVPEATLLWRVHDCVGLDNIQHLALDCNCNPFLEFCSFLLGLSVFVNFSLNPPTNRGTFSIEPELFHLCLGELCDRDVHLFHVPCRVNCSTTHRFYLRCFFLSTG